MTSLIRGDKVVRATGCPAVSHLYGEVISWFNSKRGRLLYVCETPEGAFFVSDPSHLEKINADQKRTERQTSQSG